MALNYGKAFESKFKEDIRKSFPDAYILRLYDITNGYKTIANPCDFIVYDSNRLYLIDCKSHKGSSFPFDNFTQYDKLIPYKNIPNLITGVVVWLYEKDVVVFVPTFTVEKMMNDGYKSINPNKLDRDKYYIIDIPSVKLRTFMNSDYSVLHDVMDYKTYSEVFQ